MYYLTQIKFIALYAVLFVGGLLFGFNMFNYPAYREDEGTYVSQAWSILTLNRLAPYTYWYDHAPAGWIFLSLWHKAAGFFQFGLSVNSGRAFMLILFMLSAYLVFNITLKITTRYLPSIMALMIFMLSPLSITVYRRVLLDNIMAFWILLSINFLSSRKLKLTEVMLSALSFGIAVLTKESAIFFLPLFAFISFRHSANTNRRFAVSLWSSIVIIIILFYPLFALFKKELFPTGTIFGGVHPHVSLAEAVIFQIQRTGGFFLNPDSDFQIALHSLWLTEDTLMLVLGIIASLFNLVFFRKKGYLLIASTAIIFIIYLIRGSAIYDWYISPLLPVFAINIGIFLSAVSKKFSIEKIVQLIFFVIIIGAFVYRFSGAKHLFLGNQTVNQVMAVNYLTQNIPSSAVIVIDNYAYVDLKSGLSMFPNAHYYWKVEQDPDVRINLLHDNWQNADYMLFTRAIEETIRSDGLNFINQIYENSDPIAVFDRTSYIPNPYEVEIREVKSERKYLRFGWEWYKSRFIMPSGQVVDPTGDRVTTSEGQSYAMLRAVWIDDRETFDNVWSWTKNHLQGSKNSHLFSWLTEKSDIQIADDASAADADIDITLALLFASKRWDSENYLKEASLILNDIWTYETAEVNGRLLLTAGNWVEKNGNMAVNPSYFAPYAFRIFAEANNDNKWTRLADDSYYFLNLCMKDGNALPANWCFINEQGEVVEDQIPGLDNDIYSYDAIRIPWRISLDYFWFNKQEALNFLLKMDFFKNEWKENKHIFAQYNVRGGISGETIESLSSYSTLLGYFQLLEFDFSEEVYQNKIKPSQNLSKNGVFWGQDNNYYDQNWIWFGLAQKEGFLENLWTLENKNTQPRIN